MNDACNQQNTILVIKLLDLNCSKLVKREGKSCVCVSGQACVSIIEAALYCIIATFHTLNLSKVL